MIVFPFAFLQEQETSPVTPTLTPTQTLTPSVTPSSTATPTLTPTLTSSPTLTPTLTVTATRTLTPTPTLTPTITPAYVVSGLMVDLNAANPNSYPGDGSTWFNLSNPGVNATLFNAPNFSINEFCFNGTDQYATLENKDGITNFNSSEDYSVEIWFKPEDGQPDPETASILEKWNDNFQSRYPYSFRYNENSNSVDVSCYDSDFDLYPTTAEIKDIMKGTWQQICGVFSFSKKQLVTYLNGEVVGLIPLNITGNISNTSQLNISRLSFEGGSTSDYLFKGCVGIVRIYNKELNSSEIYRNYVYDSSLY